MKIFQCCTSPTTVEIHLFLRLLSVGFYSRHWESSSEHRCRLCPRGTHGWMEKRYESSHNSETSTVFSIKKERHAGIKPRKGTLMRKSGKALLKEPIWNWNLWSTGRREERVVKEEETAVQRPCGRREKIIVTRVTPHSEAAEASGVCEDHGKLLFYFFLFFLNFLS